MNWDRIEGNWKQMKGTVRQQWAKFTDDDLEYIAGQHERFVGKIQERYGYAKDEAERQVSDWEHRVRDDWFEDHPTGKRH